MRILGVLSVIFFGMNSATAVTHSLRYLHTAASGIPAFPEFVTVVLVDGQPFSYYDSSIKRELPRQTWTVQTEDPNFWERRTKSSIVDEQVFKSKVEMIKPSFNQTGGVHIIQLMYGCEWDDETGSIKGWWQFGYNGEDLMALDLKTNTGTAQTPAATFHKHKKDKDKGWAIRMNTYLSQGCPDHLKKYVSYGKSTLLRTETPSVFLLQKNFLSPVRCHATGFYPNRAVMFWRKDGKEITEGVETGEILPNNDGTFQMSTDLKLLLDTTEKKRYECVFQLSGANESIITKLEQSKIKTNGANPYEVTISVVIAVIIFAAVIADWLIVYKGRKAADHLNVKKQMHL
ncbi:class I histocompatibility antigen, F10 alpha chain-like precursor [Oryzias latipes]|uniref:class I histocompatibility antigen, F10 alpha chain-like precursor n=1 Tax=Oryzias latipes TaxID=8090 RepID=UPI0002A4A507|nr:class I histocompatibility antigen, F10 alpha chain-like precursor [Oryzias latipes]